MLIACYQCRRQLDVPEDSAGKRVRCVHCQHVIVVPTKSADAGAESDAALAMPSMELDVEPNPQVTKLPVQPLPAQVLPEDVAKPKKAPREEMPDLPSIDRSSRRRKSATAPTAPGFRWGRMLVIGGLLGLIAIAVFIIGALLEVPRPAPPRPKAFKPAFKMPAPPPPMQAMPPIQQKFQGFNIDPQGFIPVVMNWQVFQNPEVRFKVQLPGEPAKDERNIDNQVMTVFEIKQGDWEFLVAHRIMTEKDYLSVRLEDRFVNMKRHLADTHNANLERETFLQLVNQHPGREWNFRLRDGSNQFHVRDYYVRHGDVYRHYLLQAKGPRTAARLHFEFEQFFNSFTYLANMEGIVAQAGSVVVEQIDDFALGGQRDAEFTAFALHPTRPFAVVGSADGSMRLQRTRTPQPNDAALDFEGRDAVHFLMEAGKRIEQCVVSEDGRWLAATLPGEVRWWADWVHLEARHKHVKRPGRCCVFTKNHHLLIADENTVKEYDPSQIEPLATLNVPNLAIRGLALSSDEQTLAVWGDEGITLWNWPEKKALESLIGHVGPITAAAFSPDGKTLASGGVDRAIRLWDVETRSCRATLTEHAWTVSSLAFAPDGKKLVSTGLDGMILAWDLEPDQPRLVWAESHQFPIRGAAFDAEGKHCYFTCKHPVGLDRQAGKQYARQVRKLNWATLKWDTALAERIVAQRAGLHLATSSMVHFSPDGKTIAMLADPLDEQPNDRRLRLWDTASAKVKAIRPAQMGGAFSPDGKWFAFSTPGVRAEVQMLDVAANRVMPGVVKTESPSFPMVLFTPDSQKLWVMRKNEFQLYDVPQLRIARPALELKEAQDPRFVIVHPGLDGQTFLVERGSNNVGLRTRVLYASDGTELPTPVLESGAWSAFLRLRRSPGQAVEVEDYLQGRSGSIGQQRLTMTASALSPDRALAATLETVNGQQVKLHLWDVKARKPILTLPEANARTAAQVRFSPDGRLVAYTTSAGWTRVLPTAWLMLHKERLPCNPNDVGPP